MLKLCYKIHYKKKLFFSIEVQDWLCTGCELWLNQLRKDSSEGAEEIALGREVPFRDSGERSRGRGHGVGSVPGAVSVLLWSPKGVEEDTVSVLYWCSLCAPLVQSLCSSGPQKEWKRTRSSEGAEEDTVLRRSGRGHCPQKEWKRIRCWFWSWCSLCAPLVLKGVEEDTVLVLFLVQSLCSPGPQKWKRTRCWFCSWFSLCALSGPQKEMNGLDWTGTSLGGLFLRSNVPNRCTEVIHPTGANTHF